MVNRVPRLHASAVACDNRQGAGDLASFLMDRGHATFAIVKGNAETSTSLDRERGFADRVAERGGEILMRISGFSTYHGGFAAGRMFAEMPPERRPEAVFAVADVMAMGVMDALRFDGIADAARPIYAITTVMQPLRAMIGRGLDMLTARIGDATLPDEVVTLRGELVVRRSARLAA
jgi:DNA-binding LacI/PurR family transcriptional regulator